MVSKTRMLSLVQDLKWKNVREPGDAERGGDENLLGPLESVR